MLKEQECQRDAYIGAEKPCLGGAKSCLVSAGFAQCNGPFLKANTYTACSTEPKRVSEVPSGHPLMCRGAV